MARIKTEAAPMMADGPKHWVPAFAGMSGVEYQT
jgi:hypothetical protein